jgi:hypothetical protein
LPNHIEAKIHPEPNTGCWLWAGQIMSNGYGRITVKRKTTLLHRFVYNTLIGKIPSGLVIDHKCRIKCCCNPEHLEPVTNQENLARGVAARPYCKHGHLFDSTRTATGIGRFRNCKTCVRIHNQRQYAKRKAK